MQVKREWSEYQKAIFADISNGSGHVMIEALAGSGKTSTLIESLKYIPKGKKILLSAFAKKNALDLREKAPGYSNLHIATLHSLGFAAIRAKFGKMVRFDDNKTFRIIQGLIAKYKKSPKDKDDFVAIFEMRRAVGLCKAYLIDAPSKIDDLMDEFDVSTCGYSRENFISIIIKAIGEGKKDPLRIDFDEMTWMPFIYGLPIGQWDYVYLDERQDVNMAQAMMVIAACKPGGRIILAGDVGQELFRFRGSDAELIDFEGRLKPKILSLPISYRCGRRIIYEAQKYVPAIKAAPNAIEGKVEHIKEKDLQSLIKPGDFLLSRTNAPLVKWCMRFLKAKIPANIQSKDVGASLTALIKQSNKKTVKSFLEWLYNWKDSEIKRLREKNRDTSVITDKVECMIALCEGEMSVEAVRGKIKALFNQKEEGEYVSCSTSHSSKGLERNRVFILESSFNPKYAALQSERNIRYVSITRAKRELYFVDP